MNRDVKLGLARLEAELVPHLGVDEKAFCKSHRYVTIVIVIYLEKGCVLYVAKDRQTRILDGFWKTLSPDKLGKIEGVAMDMWDPYVNSKRGHLSNADEKIVYDKFHVAKHLGEGVDRV